MLDPNSLLGTVLADRYRIESVIGRGGAATVFRAEDARHRRQVAVKVFRGSLSDFGGPERFNREIAILATLQHPHILPLLDSGLIDQNPYYVMPFVQGDTLRERLNQSPALTTQETLRILVAVADALRYAHEAGIIHRDIKPENILLSGRYAMVADFGVARADERSGLETSLSTTVGLAVGTPTYMAPEQAAADPNVDHRADIYALGIVGYEMLAGRPPFVADGPAGMLVAHIKDDPDPLGGLRPDLPPTLVSAVMRCLAKRREDRWETAASLGEQLEPLLLPSGAMTPAPGPPPRTSLRRPAALATIGILIAGSAAAAGWMLRPNGTSTAVAETRRLSTGDHLELDPVLSPDGRLLAYVTGQNGTLRLQVRQVDGGDPVAIADAVPGNHRSPSWSADGSRLAFQASGAIYQVPSLGGPAEMLVDGSRSNPAENVARSPDGTRIAYTQGGEVRIAALDGTGGSRVVVTDGGAHSLAWSPGGTRLAYVSGNRDFALSETLLGNIAPSRLMVVPVSGGTPVPVTDGESLAMSPAWLDDQRLLYVGSRGGLRDVYLQRIRGSGHPSGPVERLTTGLDAHSVRTGPDSSVTVAVLSQVSNIWSLPLEDRLVSAREAVAVTTGTQVVEDLDVHPGAGWLVYDSNFSGNQDIYLQSSAAGRPIQITRDPGDEFGPAWSPNSKEIAYYAVRDGIRHIYVMSVTGRDIRQVTADTLQDHQPRWAPDGQRLVFYRRDGLGRDRVYTVARLPDSTWSAPTAVTAPDEFATGSTWSPDGRWIAFSDAEGRIRIVDAAGGSPSRIIAGPELTDGDRLSRPNWLPFEPALLVRSQRPGGLGALWRIPLDGGTPTRMVEFDDPTRPVFRDDFATDGNRVFFTSTRFEGSVWYLRLSTRTS